MRRLFGGKFLGSLSAALALASCGTGDEFAKPNPGQLEPGNTTKSEALATFGEPSKKFIGTENGQSVEDWVYTYSLPLSAFNTLGRSLSFTFHGDTLVAHIFQSEFSGETRPPDLGVASRRLVEGGDCSEVPNIMGAPNGTAIFPVAKNPGELIYAYTSPGNALKILCNPANRIADVEYRQGQFVEFFVFDRQPTK